MSYIQSERRDLYQPYAHLLVERAPPTASAKAASEEDAGDFDRADDPCQDLCHGGPTACGGRRAICDPPADPHEGTTTFHDVSFGGITVENKTRPGAAGRDLPTTSPMWWTTT
ncbi:MAG: hypothetical protein ACLTYN_07510 [Dysosmobacter welbionis]